MLASVLTGAAAAAGLRGETYLTAIEANGHYTQLVGLGEEALANSGGRSHGVCER